MNKENTMVYIVDISIKQDNNYLSYENNVEYVWAKFVQTSKPSKGLIGMFLNNPDLAFI